MKKFLAVILSTLLVAGIMSVTAAAEDAASVLRFDENGEFKILHISDCQDDYPAEENMMTYINYIYA